MNKTQKLSKCSDCRNNFYNGRDGSNCWFLADAKPAIIHVVPTHQPNPADHTRRIERLNCWTPNAGMSIFKRS